jgi:hypothetical protein
MVGFLFVRIGSVRVSGGVVSKPDICDFLHTKKTVRGPKIAISIGELLFV